MASEVPQGWTVQCLYDLADYVNGRATKPSEIQAGGVPVIKIAELNGGVTANTDRVPADAVQDRHWVDEGDLLFAWSGSVGVYRYRGPRAALNQHIFRVTARRGVDQRFMRYLLEGQLSAFRGFVEDKKTTMGHVTVRDLRTTQVPVPPLPEQRAIAHILGTLDDKIELNRRTSQTLEAMARALFKSWFVDFDPVRAKAEGRDPGLPEPLADLFPDSFQDSELGEIPEGWEVRKLGEVIELAYGRALKADKRKPGNVPVYGSNGAVGWHDEALVEGPGIVVGRKGNPGIATWVPTNFYPIDTTFFVVSKLEKPSLHFLYHALRDQDLGSLGADSAVPGLNRNLAYLSDQILPDTDILEAYEKIAECMFRRAHQASDESRTLAALRDALLPKLISGELRVKDAERFLKERGL